MKKIITALANPNLTEEILKIKKYNMIFPDIQYQEGVLEIFETNQDANILILNSLLPGNYNLKEFITKIKEKNQTIEIIIILEKEDELIENFLISKGIFKILYNNQTTVEELIEYIEQNFKENKLNEEIRILKEIISNNSNNKKINNNNKNKIKIVFQLKIKKWFYLIKNKLKLNKNKLNKNKINNKNKIICIAGIASSGKSIVTIILSELIKNKKILIVDLNFENSSINTMFQIKKHQKSINIENTNKNNTINKIYKINNKINLFCLNEMFFEKNNKKFNLKTFQNFLNQIKTQYDYIFFDISANVSNECNKIILQNSEKILFLSEANISQLKKSKILLDKYINKWYIPVEKIKIIINKYNKYSIDKKILKNLFIDFSILGSLKDNDKYELLLNNNNLLKNIKELNKKTKKEYSKIINKLN